jgi:multidrug resistance efflux pump
MAPARSLDDLLPVLQEAEVNLSHADLIAPTSGRITQYFKLKQGETATI